MAGYQTVGSDYASLGGVEAGDMEREHPQEGLRYNEGKLRVDLVPAEWFTALAEVMTKGAEKYAERNWEAGMNWSKCYASLMRHVLAWAEGQDYDQETELHHLAHAAWNALALVTYETTHPEFDDRPGTDKRPPNRAEEPDWSDPHQPIPGPTRVKDNIPSSPEDKLPLEDPEQLGRWTKSGFQWEPPDREKTTAKHNLPVRDCGDPYSHSGHSWGPAGSVVWCGGHAYDRT